MRPNIRYLLIASTIFALTLLLLPASSAKLKAVKPGTSSKSVGSNSIFDRLFLLANFAMLDDPTADLGVTKSVNSETVAAGSNITYTIQVVNNGPDSAATAQLNDPLPDGTTFVSISSPAGWTCTHPAIGSNGTVTCTNPTLPVTSGDVFTLVVNVPAGTQQGTFFTNVASVSTATFDSNEENDSSAAGTMVGNGGAIDIAVTKSADVDQALAGTNVTYTIQVTQTGTDPANDAVLQDPLPDDMTFVSISSPAGWTCTHPAIGSNGTVTCTKPSLATTSGEVFTLVGNIPAGTVANTIYANTATVSTTSFDINPENNSSTTTTTVITCPNNPVVTTNTDNGPGSLRQIIRNVCAGGTITFDPNLIGPITLTSGELAISQGLTITGPGADVLSISGNNSSRVFNISAGSATVSISGLTIRDGKPSGGSTGGGGILINNGASAEAVNLTSCVITNNDASLTGTKVGGGIDNESSTVTIDRCSIVNNIATLRGGGIQNQGSGSMAITNSTIANNTAGATGIGGGIRSLRLLTLTNDTVFGNSAQTGGNISQSSDTVTFGNTIIAGGILLGSGGSGPDISGTVDSADYNLIQDTSGATITGTTTHNITGVSPNLFPLANYGGPTPTLLPQPSSPVINTGDPAIASGTDQRGFPRVVGGRADIGSVETNYSISATAGTPQSTPINTAFSTNLQVTVKESNNPLGNISVTFTAPAVGASGTFTGGSTTAIVTTNSSGMATAPTFTANGTAGGPYNVTASLGSAIPVATFSLTNLKGQAQVTLSNLNQTYDGTPKSVTVTTNPPGLNVVVTYNGSTTPPTNVGNYTVVATVNDPNYDGQATGTLVINKANQTITFGALANKTFGDPDFTVSASASSNLPVSFSVTGNCTISSNTVHITGAGSCTVTASQNGNSNYNAAPPVSQTFNIAKANQTINFASLANKTFGDPDFTVNATASSGFAVSFTASGQCTVAGSTVHLTGAGSCTITASQAGDSNYNAATPVPQSFTIAKAATTTTLASSLNPSDFGQAVTFTATVSSTAGMPSGTVQFKDNGANLGSPLTLVNGVATFTTSTLSSGTHTITADYSGDGNFNASTGTLSGSQVVRSQPGLSINDVSVNEGNSGTTNATFTVTLSAASNLTVTVNYATADGTATVANNDYQAASGTLTFSPGQTTKTVTVLVNGDTIAELNETFTLNLSNPVNTSISRAQGVGTISNDDAPQIQLSSASYTVAESGLHATITVNRLGDVSNPATVDYATSDPSGLTPCSQVTGNASQRCDYATSVGTLRFAAGENSKTIFIPIVNDVYVEGPESFTLTLSNATGQGLGAITSATITINDDDNGVQPNPISDDSFFVRQLYIDFLGREPEPAGLQGWLNILNHCSVPTDCDRIAVALGFIRSPEFQDRAYFAFRFYTTALGRNPKYAEFIPDMARLSGFLNSADLEANKVAFVNEFVSRQEFKTLYDPTIGDPTSYVNKLLQTVGLPNHPARNAWIAGLSNNSLTRQDVLRQLVESTEVYTKFYNQAFIVMNYFGFLRRDPDAAYQGWIDIFNRTNDYRVIANGFINSPEYPVRFGP